LSWRSSSIFLFRLRKSISSFWLEVDKSIVFVSLWNVSLSNDTSSMFFSICWSSWLWSSWCWCWFWFWS
jgi:hypothetical protein